MTISAPSVQNYSLSFVKYPKRKISRKDCTATFVNIYLYSAGVLQVSQHTRKNIQAVRGKSREE